MDRDPDECGHPGQESIDWDKDVLDAVAGRAAGAKYSMFSEGARQLLSEEKQCALFCRGKKCKYCTSDSWATDQKAIHGLYSHWVTENILAMARPSSEAIQTHNIIEQFNKAGIKSVINLQKPGEHASCGGPLHDSGFSYDPQEFMSNYIFFYNFGWPDYGVASLNTILDMVKVMQFAVTQGKVAVHCHAGLGRTGVLIACYLVYTNRMDANEAIHYVRSKRPNAVQTRTQIQCIQEFAQFLKPLRIVFASRAPDTHDFTFVQFLNRQKHILHGFEARRLKYLPKIIYTVCERLLELSGCQHVLSRVSTPSSSESHQRPSDDAERTSLLSDSSVSADTLQLPVVGGVHKSASLSDLSHPAETADLSRSCSQQQLSTSQKMADQARIHSLASQIDSDRVEGKTTKGNLVKTMPNGGLKPEECGSFTRSLVAEALAAGVYSGDVMDKVVQYEEQLNSCVETWEQLSQETDPEVLAALMWDWLNHLKEPALRSQDLTVLQDHLDDPSTGVHRLEKGIRFTVEYLMKVMVHLQPLEDALEDRVFETLLSHLTHKAVRHDAALSPAPAIASHWTEIKSSSAKKLFHFFYKYLDIVEDKVSKSTGGKSTNGFGK